MNFIPFRSCLKLICLLLLVSLTSCDSKNLELHTDTFLVGIDKSGYLTTLRDVDKNIDYHAKGVKSPLLVAVLNDSTTVFPKKMIVDKNTAMLSLLYEGDIKIDLEYRETDTHLRFEIIKAEPIDKLSGIIWGAYPTTIEETIGEVVGVVRNNDFAVGLQALNIQTTGGFPVTNAGFVPNKQGPATKTDYGSALQAFAINRSVERNVNAWEGNFINMPVPPMEGETIVGSKIALFGCSPEEVLATIGEIGIAEGLPRPEIDGEWIKTHPLRSKAYFITSFSEKNFDELLAYVKKAGMTSIYHSHPFKNWGKFELIPELFPNGNKGMKALVDKAKAQGIRVGVHTLTTFITPNDPFISPVPNTDLAMTGYGKLTVDLDKNATEIVVDNKQYFDNEAFNWMHTVQIGNELIRYRAVSDTAPYKLLDCERGAFGTAPMEHKKGDVVGKLLDHPYKVFFPNLELQKEMAQNLVDFLNETGVSHIDFDGHEGSLATGQGIYGMDDFALRVYDGVDFELVNGSSRTTHFYWHINHYINWGEPWYGKFRESQSEYRFANQPFLEANYLPNMLGWFSLTPSTSLEDIEWMLAKGAGYNAGFALSARYDALKGNPNTDKILETIRIWEKARLDLAFSDDQKMELKDMSKEFRLRETADNDWSLASFQNHVFEFTKLELQPGQPTYTEWKFNNGGMEQPLKFTISLEGGGAVGDISLEVVNYATLNIMETLKEGEKFSLNENGKLIHYDDKGQIIKERMVGTVPIIGTGAQTIQFDCKVESGSPKVKLKLMIQGNEEKVRVR